MAIDSMTSVCLCVLLALSLMASTLTAVMSIMFLLTTEDDEAEQQPAPVMTRSIMTQTDNELEMAQVKQIKEFTSISVCGKRKQCDAPSSIETQAAKKPRRIAPTPQRFVRSFSAETVSPSKRDISLRRVVSCEDARSRPTMTTTSVAWPCGFRSQEHKSEEETNDIKQTSDFAPMAKASAAASFLLDKLRKGVRNAVDEVLTSVFSFVTYAALLFVVRQYSAIAVGVSLDLGAFSIEL